MNVMTQTPPQQNIFDRLAEIIQTNGQRPVGRVPVQAQALPVEHYTDQIFAGFEEFLPNFTSQTGEVWKDFLGFTTREDIEQVTLPAVVNLLTRFAADSQSMITLFAAVSELLLFTIREHIRRGQLPVLFPTSELPTVSVEGDDTAMLPV